MILALCGVFSVIDLEGFYLMRSRLYNLSLCSRYPVSSFRATRISLLSLSSWLCRSDRSEEDRETVVLNRSVPQFGHRRRNPHVNDSLSNTFQ